MRLKESVRWLLAMGLLGSALLGRLWAPQGIAALQQTVFGHDSGAVETAIAVFAAGGSLEEAVACAAAR